MIQYTPQNLCAMHAYTPSFWRRRRSKKVKEFKIILSYISGLRLACATWNPASKNRKLIHLKFKNKSGMVVDIFNPRT